MICSAPLNTNTSENAQILNVSTRSSDNLILLNPSTSSLQTSDRSVNQTVPIVWNNLPKQARTFSNTAEQSVDSLVIAAFYRSHSVTPNSALGSKSNYVTSHTLLSHQSFSDWRHRTQPRLRCKAYSCDGEIHQVAMLSCSYGCPFKFLFLL